MKKYLIPAVAILSVLVGIVIFFVYLGYEKVHYANTVASNIKHVYEEGGELTAEYMGQKTQVVGQNINVVKKILTVYERKKLFYKPEYDKKPPYTFIFLMVLR